MAFPGDYSKWQEVTVQSSQVDADLTDFPIYVDLADLAKAGSDIFDTAKSDGGDIRVTKDDGTTQLAREVVSIDTTAETGELHVKFSGTLSSSSNTTIRIWYNGSDSEPAADSTYGSENVWSDYEFVSHDGGGADSTGNHSPSANGGITANGVTGQIGNATDFDGTDDNFDITNTSVNTGDTGEDLTVSLWFNGSNVGDEKSALVDNADGIDGNWVFLLFFSNLWFRTFGGSNGGSNSSVSNGSFIHTAYVWDVGTGGNLYIDGSLDKSDSNTDTSTGQADIKIGDADSDGDPFDGIIDEVRMRNSLLSSNWISTEYNNQNSPSTFYNTSDEKTTSSRRIFNVA